MQELKIIEQQEVLGKDFKVYGDVDNPLFMAKDVAEWIEHSKADVMIETVDENEKLKETIFTSGQNREVWFLTEDGLYEVLMQSRKPIAKEFKVKVKEILRSIRKHGAYMTPDTLDKMISSPEFGIRLLTALKDEQDKNKELQIINSELSVQNAIMEPKALYFDELIQRNLLTNFRDTAKALKVKEKDFINYLLNKKYIYRDKKGKIMPYADKNNGLFEIKECFNDMTNWVGTQTLITPKGRETFRLLFS